MKVSVSAINERKELHRTDIRAIIIENKIENHEMIADGYAHRIRCGRQRISGSGQMSVRNPKKGRSP